MATYTAVSRNSPANYEVYAIEQSEKIFRETISSLIRVEKEQTFITYDCFKPVCDTRPGRPCFFTSISAIELIKLTMDLFS